MQMRRAVTAQFFGIIGLISLTACKGPLKEIQFVAPAGTQIEYSINAGASPGQLVLPSGSEAPSRQTVAINAEAESVTLVIRHPFKKQAGSPDLKIKIEASSGSREGFEPGDVETQVRLRARDAEPNGFQDARCGNLVRASGGKGSLTVEILPPTTPGDCEDKALRNADPRWIGRGRDVADGLNYFSQKDDARMGQDFVTEFNGKNRQHLVRDAVALPYLQGIMNRIAANSDAPHVRPQVHLINANVVNAFALPGGAVYVFRGIMESVRDEGELIGILGHEWGHVTARHGTRNVTRAINGQLAFFTIALAAELAASKSDEKDKAVARAAATVAQLAAYVGSQYYVMAGSREAEEQADTLGAQYAYRIGFAPDGIGNFFAAMLANHGPRTWLEDMFASHPDHGARVDANKANITSFYPEDAMKLPADTLAFHNVRTSMVASLPPMLSGKQANDMLALQFLETNRKVAYDEINQFFVAEGSKRASP